MNDTEHFPQPQVPAPQHAFGWRPPLPGRSAIELLPPVDTSGLEVKPVVDPRKAMPPALDQLNLGACTANAANRAMRYDTILDGKDCTELSRLWTYFFERAIEHLLGQGDTGAYGHDAFIVAKHGIPAESKWPYDISRFEDKPPACKPRAYTLKKAVHAVPWDEHEFKLALSQGQTVAIGFTVYESFESTWDQKGVMPMPSASEGVLGGHEVLVCGYLPDYPGHVLVLNSWGTGWGIGGYFLMPLKFLLDQSQASDFRTIVRPIAA